MNKERRSQEYTFTGFYPSGNSFLWYYDENKRTMFATSNDVQKWNKKPKKRDVIKIEREYTPTTNDITRAWINGGLVYSITS